MWEFKRTVKLTDLLTKNSFIADELEFLREIRKKINNARSHHIQSNFSVIVLNRTAHCVRKVEVILAI